MHIYSSDPEAAKLVRQGAQQLVLELERTQQINRRSGQVNYAHI